MSVPMDQSINAYPSLEEVTWHDNLTANLLFGQFLTAAAPYNNLASLPTGDLPSVIQQTMSFGELSIPTRELTGPVRLKRAHARVFHACDDCRHKKKKCSGEQPVCLSCQKTGKVCTWTPMKNTKYRPSRKHDMAKLCRSPSRACGQDPMTGPRQPYIAAPKPTYPIRLMDMQAEATSASAMRNAQVVSIPSVEFPMQIATGQTRTVGFDWSDLGLSDFNRVWIPPPFPCPPHFGNALSCAHPLRTRQRPRNEYFCRRALVIGQ
ncbi:hypothetical protein DFH29DRAFT_195347 [Suillus ampliporus]|nr:hypothetical protein DFH29DRAFT_195347 [Suillus ampliporus]